VLCQQKVNVGFQKRMPFTSEGRMLRTCDAKNINRSRGCWYAWIGHADKESDGKLIFRERSVRDPVVKSKSGEVARGVSDVEMKNK
jgi:hypothetical protein